VQELLDQAGAAIARALENETGVRRQVLVGLAGVGLLFIVVGVLILYVIF
jgi:hypothetical protein